MTDKTWGGAREGAGRKPVEDKRVQMIITIAAETRDKLKAISKARGDPLHCIKIWRSGVPSGSPFFADLVTMLSETKV